MNNIQLNLGLEVPYNVPGSSPVNRTSEYYHVKFNDFKSAYNVDGTIDTAYYPAEKYYIMLVKNSKKTLFSLTAAEDLLKSTTGQF